MVQSTIGVCKEPTSNSLDDPRHQRARPARVPTPMPNTDSWTHRTSPAPIASYRMSNLKKYNHPLRNNGTTAPAPAPTPPPSLQMARQAHQFLEANVKAWMKPEAQMRVDHHHHQQILQHELTVNGSSFTAPSSSITHHALNEHNQSFRMATGHGKVVEFGPVETVNYKSMMVSRRPHHETFESTMALRRPIESVQRQQASAAAFFYARAAQKLNEKSSAKWKRHQNVLTNCEPAEDDVPFITNFSEILGLSPPPAPPALLRSVGRKDVHGLGKVKVMLRITSVPSQKDCSSSSSFLVIDSRKKQVTAYDPSICGFVTPEDRRVGVAAPKMFAFDAIFSQDDSQTEICSSSLTEVVQAVVNGTDGCLFSYGCNKLGKTYTMVGKPDSVQTMGIIPCAISWLFKLINEEKQKTGARFSVRVSAVEISGKKEELQDLLAEYANGTENSGTSPGIYLKDDPIFGTQLQNQSELRAPTVEKAAYYLDAALTTRSNGDEDEDNSSHFLFTLHVYQYRIDKSERGVVAGGRSRLHLLDLGSCDKQGKNPQALSLSAITNVILAIFNGQKHIPYKNCNLTRLLCELLGSLTCRAAMIAHVSGSVSNYAETLSTIQFASRIHRLRRKKLKPSAFCLSDNYCDDGCYPSKFSREETAGKSGSSDPEYTSSSEQSCDTVIYVGPNGLPLSDRELTDNEGPPIIVHRSMPPPASIPSAQAQTQQQSAHIMRPIMREMGQRISLLPGSNKTLMGQSADVQVRNDMTVPNADYYYLQSRASPQNLHQIEVGGRTTVSAGSEECWVDGPRFSKSIMEARNTKVPGNEMWVDGPQASYGYMDVHKRNMIQRWVELQSMHVQLVESSQDYPKSGNGLTGSDIIDSQRLRCKPVEQVEPEVKELSTEGSNQIVFEQEDNIGHECYVRLISEDGSVGRNSETYSEEPVKMQDSCLQVTEDDILTACMVAIMDHPLRILSEENLASSFTDSLSLGENYSSCQSDEEQEDESSERQCNEAMSIAIETLSRLSVPTNLSGTFSKMVSLGSECEGSSNGNSKNEDEVDDELRWTALRLPDGASNPNLCEEPSPLEREKMEEKIAFSSIPERVFPGNGAHENGTGNHQSQDEVKITTPLPITHKPNPGIQMKRSRIPVSVNRSQSNCIPRRKKFQNDLCPLSPVVASPELSRTKYCDNPIHKSHMKNDLHLQASGMSSGYESMVRDSEGSGSSFSNTELTSDTSEDEEHKKSLGLNSQTVIELKVYEKEDVERIERRRTIEETHDLRKYHQRVLQLRLKQSELRRELALTKERLMLSPKRWSYNLHVEESVDITDPCFLEALERETQILEKRVMACKSHVMLVTCFDSSVVNTEEEEEEEKEI